MGQISAKVGDMNEEKNLGIRTSVISTSNINKKRLAVVQLMLPVYYTANNRINADELEISKQKWGLILENKAPYFLAMRGHHEYTQATCISHFYDMFYSRFFDIHPMARPMFSAGLKSQGKFLAQMMSLILNVADKDDKFDEVMIKLAEVHNSRGVKALEYGIVGEVLFWTLRHCLGPDYDMETHRIWVKLFSRMLSVIVPNAVQFEIECGTAQTSRFCKDKVNNETNKEEELMPSSSSINTSSHNTFMKYFEITPNFLRQSRSSKDSTSLSSSK